MNRLIMGRYFPGDSFIHRLDPRFKLFFVIYFMALLFLFESLYSYLLFISVTLLFMQQSGVAIKIYIRGIRPLIWLILFASTLRMLTTRGGELFFTFGPFAVTSFGLTLGSLTFMRFVLIILMSTVLTLTTKPIDLTDAIYFYIRPLKVLYVPVEDLSLMLSIALRFIPNLLDETDKVMNAQRARGMVFGEGNLVEQMRALVPLVLPLFRNSLKRAEEMADTLEVKGYQSDQKRTHYRILTWSRFDSMGVLVVILLAAVAVFLG